MVCVVRASVCVLLLTHSGASGESAIIVSCSETGSDIRIKAFSPGEDPDYWIRSLRDGRTLWIAERGAEARFLGRFAEISHTFIGALASEPQGKGSPFRDLISEIYHS